MIDENTKQPKKIPLFEIIGKGISSFINALSDNEDVINLVAKFHDLEKMETTDPGEFRRTAWEFDLLLKNTSNYDLENALKAIKGEREKKQSK